jgi:two-component system sensor histidine kinase DegS
MEQRVTDIGEELGAARGMTPMMHRLEVEMERIKERLPGLEEEHRKATEDLGKATVIRRHVARNPEKFSPHERESVFERAQNVAVHRQELESGIEALKEHMELMEQVHSMLLEESAIASASPERGALEVYQAVEAERLRIAHELHAGPAQILSNLVLEAEILERLLRRDPELLAAELQEFKISVRNAVADMRRFMFELRPISLDDLGLIATMRRITAEYQDRTGVVCRFNTTGEDRRLAPEMEEALYWIIQEAMANVHRHAEASNVEVLLDIQPERAALRVKDDGQGFDPRNYHQPGGRRKLGVLGMKERAAAVGGSFEVRSQPGGGTTVEAAFELS